MSLELEKIIKTVIADLESINEALSFLDRLPKGSTSKVYLEGMPSVSFSLDVATARTALLSQRFIYEQVIATLTKDLIWGRP